MYIIWFKLLQEAFFGKPILDKSKTSEPLTLDSNLEEQPHPESPIVKSTIDAINKFDMMSPTSPSKGGPSTSGLDDSDRDQHIIDNDDLKNLEILPSDVLMQEDQFINTLMKDLNENPGRHQFKFNFH